MDNNNLKEKFEKSLEVESGKKKNKNFILMIAGVVLAIFLAIFLISLLIKSPDSATGDVNGGNTSAVETDETVIIQEPSETESSGFKPREKIERSDLLKKDFKSGLVLGESITTESQSVIDNDSGEISVEYTDIKIDDLEDFNEKVKDTTSEYQFISKEITDARNEYYRTFEGLNETLKSYFPSAEDGYTSDKSQMMDKELLSSNYTPVLLEDIESFITHELEKRGNPSYSGGSLEKLVEDIVITQSQYYGGDSETLSDIYLPQYTVSFRTFNQDIYQYDDYQSFTFALDEEGNKIWITE